MAYYRKKQLQELIDWTPDFPMELVSISESDKNNGSPKEGDKIAFNPKDPTDIWLVAKQFFDDNYEFVSETLETAIGRHKNQQTDGNSRNTYTDIISDGGIDPRNQYEQARPRSFTYSTNMMGPWSLDWYRDRGLLKNVWKTVETEKVANLRRMDIGEKYLIEEVTEQYAGGRIDIRGDTESPYGDEYGVAPMLMEDWNAFGEWLRDLETTEQWDYDMLISIFEGEVLNGRKIRWASDE